MIRAYTTNAAHVSAIEEAAKLKSFQAEFQGALDGSELAGRIDELSVLLFDLTCASFSADHIVGVLDTLPSDRVPPVLYLLGSAADIEFITQAGSIINQDYSFIPIDAPALAARLEVLRMLGARRKLTLETAITDRLTGLYNRKYFIRRLEEELYRSQRYGFKVGILLATVDFEAPGHKLTEEAGSAVMRRISEFFKGRLRKSDILARYKWDDFAFLLPDITLEDSLAVAADVKKKLEHLPVRAEGLEIKLKLYVGHVLFPVEGLASAIDVMGALDDCVFAAKKSSEGFVSYVAQEQEGA